MLKNLAQVSAIEPFAAGRASHEMLFLGSRLPAFNPNRFDDARP